MTCKIVIGLKSRIIIYINASGLVAKHSFITSIHCGSISIRFMLNNSQTAVLIASGNLVEPMNSKMLKLNNERDIQTSYHGAPTSN